MERVDPIFEDNDLSGLPSSNPGSGKPWVDPTSHAIIVGALGTFGMTQTAADARYVQIGSNATLNSLTIGVIDVMAAINSKAASVHGHAISDVTGLQTALDSKQAALGYTPVNRAGDAGITGNLSSTAAFIAGLAAINYSGAAFKVGAAGTIEFAPTSVDGTTDAKIVRSSTGVLDVRANSGLRILNFAGSLYQSLGVGAITHYGNLNPWSAGAIDIGASGTPFGNLYAQLTTLTSNSASAIPLIIKGVSGQTTYIECRDNSNVATFGIGPTGFACGASQSGWSMYTTGLAGYTAIATYSNEAIKIKNVSSGADSLLLQRNTTVAGTLTVNSALYLPPKTFATLPSASAETGARYRLTDRSQREVYSDGTNWRFASDDSIAS